MVVVILGLWWPSIEFDPPCLTVLGLHLRNPFGGFSETWAVVTFWSLFPLQSDRSWQLERASFVTTLADMWRAKIEQETCFRESR